MKTLSLNKGLNRRPTLAGFVPLLDQSFATGATAAYSLRLLKEKHAGGLVRVRASDSGTNKGEADVLPDSDNVISLNSKIENLNTTAQSRGLTNSDTLADLVNHSGGTPYDGFVPKWYGQTSNQNDATNSVASEQPKIYDATNGLITENGKPALDFDGISNNLETDDSATWSIISSGNQFEFFFVLTPNEDTGEIIAKDNEYDFAFINKSGTPSNSKVAARFGYFGDNTESANFSEDLDAQKQYLLDFFGEGGVGVQLDYNNNTYFDHSSTATSSNINPVFKIGDRAGTDFFKGKMQEIIYFETKKASDRSNIKTNINNYYSIY